jgi:hypothetical protein
MLDELSGLEGSHSSPVQTKENPEDPMQRPRKKSAGRGLPQNPQPAPKSAVENAGEQLEECPPEQLENNHGSVRWKPSLDSYQDLRALQFRTPEHFAVAAKLLWTGELRELPYDLVGNHTIIVPADAVSYFLGLEVTETGVLQPSDMPPQELSELRAEQGPY